MRSVFSERFEDIKILRYELTGFEELSLNQKIYIYYLSKAAFCGRDIIWDQNNRYNLKIRRLLETIFLTFRGDRSSAEFDAFYTYLKRVWFANGIHHHYSTDKFNPGLNRSAFEEIMSNSDLKEINFNGEIDDLLDVIFDPGREAKRVNLDSQADLLTTSAMNYYKGVSQKEAERFYASLRMAGGKQSPSFGLNSQLTKENGKLKESVWKANGKYGPAIRQIIFWLEKAIPFAENEQQAEIIEKLISYYETGDLSQFDDYNILWVKESEGRVDFVNGFIEVYGDPLGIKGSWESIVNYKDLQGTERTRKLSENALWFETHSPVDEKFRKSQVNGVSAKVIHVAALGGDCYPATPIGINLPNSEWIRETFGSKSVTIENITHSYFLDSLDNGMLEEFAASGEEIERARKYGYLAGNLHTDLHECLGHGSGKMNQGVNAEDLKNYYSTIEETRADLFALYYITDKKLSELGIAPSEETGKAEYDAYIRNALLTQLTRVETGKDLEESHMRNRQLIAGWVYEHGSEQEVVEFFRKEDRTYVRIRDYERLRELFGELLREVQRIKSEGNYIAAKNLVESYGVRVNHQLHEEVIQRFRKLGVAPYAGFINPRLELVKDEQGKIIDVEADYIQSYTEQMLEYAAEFSFLTNAWS
ncbi:MAG: dihydrofolate reductase [Prolixibacteraceae bacterium]